MLLEEGSTDGRTDDELDDDMPDSNPPPPSSETRADTRANANGYREIPLADGRSRLGLEPEFAESLGDRWVGLELPPVGARFRRGETFGFVHCADATHDLRAPRDLVVSAVNPRAIAHPGLARLSPTGDGWLVEIETEAPRSLESEGSSKPLRVVVLGNSGSGKSTLAAALAGEGIARLDLDTVAWEPGLVARPRDAELARADVDAFCRRNESWIVEGCYEVLAAAAFEHRPKLVFLNPGLEACLANCRSRPWEPHKYASKREQDERLEFLLSWVADHYVREGPLSLAAHAECFRSYAGPKRELREPLSLHAPDPEFLRWLRE